MEEDIREKLENFFNKYRKVSYGAKEILIRADCEPEGVFFLTEGVVRMYAVSASGEEVVINVFKPVSFFPMGWVLNDNKSHFYFEAINDVKVIKAPKDEFLRFLKSEPEVVFNLLKRIYQGLEGYFSRMEYLMSGNAQSRLITEILIFAKRLGVATKNGVKVNLKMTEKDLAAQTGIARETVSREIHKLKEKGLIEFDNSIITVLSIDDLEQELTSI